MNIRSIKSLFFFVLSCPIFQVFAFTDAIPFNSSTLSITNQNYLEQGRNIFAYNAISIPGDLIYFEDPKGEAVKYHSHFPAFNRFSYRTHEAYFSPAISRPSRYQLFNLIYIKNNLANIKPASTYLIPPIIHQIWVGPKSHKQFERMRQTWLKKHPGWIYKLWTDEDVQQLKLINQAYYDSASNFAEKADILRYELLYLFGGVYVDMDTESVTPLDILHRCYTFYGGWNDNIDAWLINGTIGAAPNHPIIRAAIESIPNRINALHMEVPYSTGPLCLTDALISILPYIFFETPFIVFPKAYLHADMLPDWSGPKNAAPYTFVAHVDAGSWTNNPKVPE